MSVTFRIRELAEARGWNATELTAQANRQINLDEGDRAIGYNSILTLWNETAKNPRTYILNAVAKALGVEIGDLYKTGD